MRTVMMRAQTYLGTQLLKENENVQENLIIKPTVN